MIKAVFFDVDGTLLSHKTRQVPDDTKQVLQKLREKGIKIFVSTGRHPVELSRLPVNDMSFNGYITLNGQLCLDGEKRVIYGNPFTKTAAKRLVSLFESKKYPMSLVEEKRIYINFVNDAVCKAQESVSSPVPMIDGYDGGQIYQVTSYVTEKEAFQLEADLPDGCKMARWSDGGVDVIPADSGKTRGMEYFCAYYDIKPEETMAFGDAENDMDMLRSAQIGVAMGNAHNCVKTIADFVTTDVDRAGIRYAIEHFHII